MSVAIDRVIKSAEKSIRFGDFESAMSTCYHALKKYPKNPRLNALAQRLTEPQIDRIPQSVVEELQSLSLNSEWLLLTKRCLELLESYENSAIVWNFLGCGQLKKGYALLAKSSLMKSVQIDPEYAGAYSNLGNALHEIGELEASEKAQKMSLRLDPNVATAHNNLGALYETLGKHEEALQSFQKSHSLDPEYASGEYNLGGANLQKKNFKKGWKQREARWKRWVPEEGLPFIETSRPLWDGTHADRLYVWSEQGIGDEVMFASTLNETASRCESLVVACNPRLIKLFERSFGDRMSFVSRGVGIPDEQFDCHAPAMTATGLLRQNINDFRSSNNSYLMAHQPSVESLRSTIEAAAGGKPIIGISWRSKSKKYGKSRSISPVELVAAIPNDVFLVNLQYDDVREDAREVASALNRHIAIFDNIDNYHHLDAFTSLISACDKVVSIDNSTVHFAGALGKECHVLLPYSTDWRWGRQNDEECYWYKSLLLHRQTKLNDWSAAINSLKHALNENSPS